MFSRIVSKRFVGGVLLAITMTTGFVVGRASAAQPHMQNALDALYKAKRELNAASNDKGGHRQNALELVNKAINQVEKGIQYDRRN